MKKIALYFFSVFLFLSGQVRAQSSLEPFFNFLRETPAFMNGEVSFNRETVLYQEGWSIVKILANQSISFSFTENHLQVWPNNAFYVKYGGARVKIKSVTWTPSGMKTESEFPADFTGLSRGIVGREVADTLQKIFGAQLTQANDLIKRVRRQKTLGQIFDIAKSAVYVFTRSGSATKLSLPNYRGEIGLNFLPSSERAFNLYGMRVGIHAHDHYRTSIKFNGDTNGIYPYSAALVSRDGSDINQGSEYKLMKRLVLETVSLDSSGIGLKLHLGASEIVGGVLSALEELDRRRGGTGNCPRCAETASVPAIRILIEGYVRTAIMAQVDALWSYLPGFNVPAHVMNSFKRHEGCRVRNLSCLKNCNGTSNNEDDVKACKTNCDRTLNQCLRQ